MSDDQIQAPARAGSAGLLERGLETLFAGGKEAEAFSLLRAAAEAGDPQGQYVTGMLYHLGKGTAKDRAKSVFWLTKAAQQGHADARYELGELRACARAS